jgi:SlyX protein
MRETALERIELKIAFLERANQELSDAVYRQQREIETLRVQMAVYQRQIAAVKTEPVGAAVDERPPHY